MTSFYAFSCGRVKTLRKRLRVDGDKNMRLLAFAFTIVFVWTGPKFGAKTNINYGAKFVCWHDLKTDDPSKFKSTRKRRRFFDDVSRRERLVSISAGFSVMPISRWRLSRFIFRLIIRQNSSADLPLDDLSV